MGHARRKPRVDLPEDGRGFGRRQRLEPKLIAETVIHKARSFQTAGFTHFATFHLGTVLVVAHFSLANGVRIFAALRMYEVAA